MGIFRTRALDAANQDSTLEKPLLLLKPNLNRLQSNWLQILEQFSDSTPGSIQATQEQRQQHPTECGAVSLSIILKYYGCHRPISEIRHACGVSRNGSDAANLVRAAQYFGLEAKGFKKGLKSLDTAKLPAIIFWNFNHFVVLEGIKNHRYWINDPAAGRRCIDYVEFDRYYTGIILTMRPGKTFQRTSQPPGSIQLLVQVIRQCEPATLITLTACTALASYGLSAAMANHLWVSKWALPSLTLGLLLIPFAQACSRQLQTKAAHKLQHHLLRMPTWVIQQHLSSELSSRLQRVPSLAKDIRHHGWANLPLFVAVILSTVSLLPKHPALVGLVALGITMYAVATAWIERSNSGRQAQERIAARTTIEVVQLAFQDPESLKTSCLEREYLRRWAGRESEATATRQRLAYRHELQAWIPKLIGWATPLLLLGFGLTGPGQPLEQTTRLVVISIGLVLAQQRWELLQSRWNRNTTTLRSLQSMQEQPVDPLLHEASHKTGIKPPNPKAASMELVDVSFGFLPLQAPLLAHLSLKVGAGDRIAIVGASASGKSTLVRLMTGLLQPQQGIVKLDGEPLMSWPRQDRIQTIAMVSQEKPVISCTLRQALTYWNPSIPIGDIKETCHELGILTKIESLPCKFETPMDEAFEKLSGGEYQRLQIVQALLQQPALLILDEATSALDAKSEHKVKHVLNQLDCTQITVSHRLSTIRDANQILVLKDGAIAQQGRHDELAAMKGSPYQTLLQLEPSSSNIQHAPN